MNWSAFFTVMSGAETDKRVVRGTRMQTRTRVRARTAEEMES